MTAAAPPAAALRPVSFLAFDFGTRRVGVATGNTLLGRAQPLAGGRRLQPFEPGRCLELAAALLEGIAEPTVLGLLHCAMSELAAADLDDQTAFDQLARAEQYLVRLNASQGSELGREASRVKSALQRRLKWPINPS